MNKYVVLVVELFHEKFIARAEQNCRERKMKTAKAIDSAKKNRRKHIDELFKY